MFFGLDETENIGQAFEQSAFEKAKKKKRKKSKKMVRSDPPASSLCIERSLSDLRAQFGFENVTLRVPDPRLIPLEGFFTLYDGFFYLCFLRLPIPRLILDYVISYQIALSQITARSLRHLIGILVRGYETENEVALAHLRNYLQIRRVPKSEVDKYYISPAKNKKIIEGSPSKDDAYTNKMGTFG